MGLRTGLELEFHLLDCVGDIVNEADSVINHPLNQGYIVPEVSKSMIEVTAPPGDSVRKTLTNFKKQLELLINITSDLGLFILPSTSIGADVNLETNNYKDWSIKKTILGDINFNLAHHICGTHIHLDQLGTPEKIAKQFNVYTAMDPVFSLMSATPFLFGNNTKKDYRVETYRNIVYGNLPLNGQLRGYFDNYSDIIAWQKNACDIWISLGLQKGKFDSSFTPYNSIWGPLRITDKKTVESRGSDANLFSNVAALLELYYSITMFIDKKNPAIVFDTSNDYSSNKYFIYENNTIMLPNFDLLKQFEVEGSIRGLECDILSSYLSSIVNLGLDNSSNPDLLSPFVDLITTKHTFADDIVGYALRNNLEIDGALVDVNASRNVALYIYNTFIADLNVAKFN